MSIVIDQIGKNHILSFLMKAGQLKSCIYQFFLKTNLLFIITPLGTPVHFFISLYRIIIFNNHVLLFIGLCLRHVYLKSL